MPRAFGALALLLTACSSTGGSELGYGGGWPLVYSQDFANGESLEDLSFSDHRAWRWSPSTTGVPGALELAGESLYKPKHRSPYCIALLHGRVYQSFVLEADMLQTGKEYGHRDLCLFFGFQDPEHFHYVHLATAPDDRAHNIFLVNAAPRVKTSPVAESGVEWGTGEWHRVRLERDVELGETRVYFDDMLTPTLSAKNETFDWGLIGFGSFDDTGRFANVKIWAPEVLEPFPGAREPFKRPDKLQFP